MDVVPGAVGGEEDRGEVVDRGEESREDRDAGGVPARWVGRDRDRERHAKEHADGHLLQLVAPAHEARDRGEDGVHRAPHQKISNFFSGGGGSPSSRGAPSVSNLPASGSVPSRSAMRGLSALSE